MSRRTSSFLPAKHTDKQLSAFVVDAMELSSFELAIKSSLMTIERQEMKRREIISLVCDVECLGTFCDGKPRDNSNILKMSRNDSMVANLF